jgi:2',3'-cyclic-nucleotide 2'-phosphodiesterase
MKILYFADTVGKLGRAGIVHQLPLWHKQFMPDVVVINGENLAHGMGIGRLQIQEMREAGVDIFTGGNHVFEGKDALEILADLTVPIIRPANASVELPGRGYIIKETSAGSIAVINLIGQTTGKYHYDSPFTALENILQELSGKVQHILVDWHAEFTSEKSVMGWFGDGKVSAVVGSHTHVPTADAKILPQGTAYISDVGMTGPYNSVISFDPEASIKKFTKQIPIKPRLVQEGPIEINAVFIETDSETGKAIHIQHLQNIAEL